MRYKFEFTTVLLRLVSRVINMTATRLESSQYMPAGQHCNQRTYVKEAWTQHQTRDIVAHYNIWLLPAYAQGEKSCLFTLHV